MLQQSIFFFLWARYLYTTVYDDKVLYGFFIIYDYYLNSTYTKANFRGT